VALLDNALLEPLADACAGSGVRAIVATNTLARPSPANPRQDAGLGGSGLFPHARKAQELLQRELTGSTAAIDLIACGGILDGASWKMCEAKAGQYWSALVWRGPLAAALT
jgi:dihydroorotate dehydrogenase